VPGLQSRPNSRPGICGRVRPVRSGLQEAQRLLSVTYPSARRNVEKLVEAEILRPVADVSYRKTYVAAEILEIIVEQEARL